jgi:hypothetical protein
MTDTTNITQMPGRPARRRKGTATPAPVPSDGLGLAMALGGLREAVEGLQKDFQSEREESRASRARLHTRIDDVIEVVHGLDKKVDKAGDVSNRLRDIEDRRLPDVEDEVATLRKTRNAIALFGVGAIKIGIATAGVTAAGTLLWFREGLAALLGRLAGLLL